MLRCPHCNFLSDPKTGDIFDARFPCPKCGKKALRKNSVPVRNLRAVRCSYNPKGLGSNFAETSKMSKAAALIRTLGFGVGFYFAYTKLNEIEEAEDSRNRKLKMIMGDMLPALKTASYLIPALAIPEVVSLVKGKERPLISTAYKLALVYAMVWVAGRPFTKELDSEPAFAV